MTSANAPARRHAQGTWLFGRHADVAVALRDRRLVPVGQGNADPAVHERVRDAVRDGLSPEQLAHWRTAMVPHAHALLDALRDDAQVDLVQALARPWSATLAIQVTALPAAMAGACLSLAESLYQAVAESRDGRPSAQVGEAASELARHLASLPQRQGATADVQTFVALSQTLPALLAGAWKALLHDSAALARLQAQPGDVPHYLHELLRLGSPARVVFREAAVDLEMAGVRVQQGDSVGLDLAQANRDPLCFTDPDRLIATREATGHFGLGAGPHHCAGAAIVRLALDIATRTLMERGLLMPAAQTPAEAAAEPGGYAMRLPGALWVRWRRRPQA